MTQRTGLESELTMLQPTLASMSGRGNGYYLDPNDRDDALQDSNVALLTAVRNDRVRDTLEGLACRVFQRQAAREIGRQQRSRSRHRRYSPATDTRLNTCSPSDRLARHEHEMRIGQAINLLPERERQAVKLKFFDNQTYDRIADRLGITAEEVGTLLQRALRRLRPHLESVVRP